MSRSRLEVPLIRDKILQKARFEFALDCLNIVVKLTPFENVAFSPYSLYEGLMMIYFASSCSSLTEKHLKCFLVLPEEVSKNDWMFHNSTERLKENREKLNGYYDQNYCWINKAKLLKDVGPNLFNPNKFIEFDFNNRQTNLMHRINEALRIEMQSYIPQSIEFSSLGENMEFILSSVLCFKSDTFQHEFLTDVPENYFQRQPKTVISPKLEMLVTELPFINKTQSLFALFPVVEQDSETNNWQIDENIFELVKRLTTMDGIKELNKVLNDKESSTEKLSTESVIYPDFFELENELQIDELLEKLAIKSVLKPYAAHLHGFTHLNIKLGGAKHRTYIKVASENIVTASAVNMFFTENGGSFSLNQELNRNTKYEKSFVWLIYDRYNRTILFIGVINKIHNKNLQLIPVSSAAHTSSV